MLIFLFRLWFSIILSCIMKICAVTGCNNSSRHIADWKKFGGDHPRPCTFHRFPCERYYPDLRATWIKLINRTDPTTKKLWQPSRHDYVCSIHFTDKVRHKDGSKPTLHLGYTPTSALVKPSRSLPKKRKLPKCSKVQKRLKLDETVLPTGIAENEGQPRSPRLMKKRIRSKRPKANFLEVTAPTTGPRSAPHIHDHSLYAFSCDCSDGCECTGCGKKNREIKQLQQENKLLRRELLAIQRSRKINASMVDTCLSNDADCRYLTGLLTIAVFNNLFNHLSKKAAAMQYWKGQKEAEKPVKHNQLNDLVVRSGPKRKLDQKEEFFLVLLKLRQGVSMHFLAKLFRISQPLTSSIFNTWVKFMAFELQSLIYWPSRDLVKRQLPYSLRMCKNLVCTIDCTEIFIGYPRDREIQCLTWSDYKKHNTVKFLIAIAPNGMICYLSPVWGGKATDRHITLADDFMKNIMPGDLVLADRGFIIKDAMLKKQARLEIPPSSSGVVQMTRDDVFKTKRVAKSRIHVERAIGRAKYFAILKHVLPVNLLPLIDDIVTVCACLSNLRPPLV